MTDEQEEKKGFKVNDKRRFDEEGNEKDGGSSDAKAASAPPKTAPSEAAPEQEFEMKESKPQAGAAHELNFSSFVVSLATQALMQLGEMPSPEGYDIPKDKEAAKQTIDIISILDEKTKGNLDADESRLMEEILHNLRMAFVKAE